MSETDAAVFVVDAERVREVRPQQREAWLYVYRPGFTMDGRELDHTLIREEFNCAERTSRRTMAVGYALDGAHVFTEHPKQDFAPVIPDSVGEQNLQFMCGDRTSRMKKFWPLPTQDLNEVRRFITNVKARASGSQP